MPPGDQKLGGALPKTISLLTGITGAPAEAEDGPDNPGGVASSSTTGVTGAGVLTFGDEGGTMGMAEPPGDQKLGGALRRTTSLLAGTTGVTGPGSRTLGTNSDAEPLRGGGAEEVVMRVGQPPRAH